MAQTISASLRHSRTTALEAFDRLLDSDQDMLLGVAPVEELIAQVGSTAPERSAGAIARALESPVDSVQESGGRLAAYAALEFGRAEHLERAVVAEEVPVRAGAATVCAESLPFAG